MQNNAESILDPRYDSAVRDLYYTAKDLRMSARQKEKHGDISATALEHWKMIRQQLMDLFAAGCADLELCSWLAEAALRLEGFAGLAEAFSFTHGLADNHGTALTSIEPITDSPQYWIAPITELSGEGCEGVLIQPLRLCPLVPQSRYGEHSLWHYQCGMSAREQEPFRVLSQTIRDTGSSAMQAQREEIGACIRAYEAMLAHLDSLLPAHPASRTNLLATLDACTRAINDLTGFNETDSQAEQTSNDVLQLPPEPADQAAELYPIKITNRELALRLLGDVAHFFRRHEPQSPLAPALETLIRRGHLPFDALLEDLLPDADTRRVILMSAGIQPDNSDNR
ncbi:ImpA family type VI secretion system protein [Brucella oryzae]|uniref:ImpA N-terminal domain-containing protein n=1 Tax=Brucella oryzae TaxID=335286 RepID=A0A2S7J107_9HYPH|nr:type VI secretion system ImpA family N-terminal domain-containing protein [Brucella oryzae]PQA73886.1 hypothetical protein C3731_08695 [Brucella oryzae]